VQRSFRAIVERHRNDAPAHVTGESERFLARQTLFEEIARDGIADVHEYDEQGLVELALSTSHVARLGPDEQAASIAEVRAIADGGRVRLPYVVELFAYRQAATTSH
jgi:hypothetical protein